MRLIKTEGKIPRHRDKSQASLDSNYLYLTETRQTPVGREDCPRPHHSVMLTTTSRAAMHIKTLLSQQFKSSGKSLRIITDI